MSDESDFRQILGQMEVWLSYGTIMNLASSRGGDGSSGRPPGDEHPAHLVWRERWDRAFNKRKVLEDAQEALEGMLKQKVQAVVPETQGELEARVLREGEGWGVVEIAQHCRCTEKFARKSRLRGGVSLEDGKAIVQRRVEREQRVQEAREMRDRGLTLRQIAMQLGCNAATIQRDLASAA
jgi:hypothetical protein